VVKEAWLFCRTSSGVRLCWELAEPKGPEGHFGPFTIMPFELFIKMLLEPFMHVREGATCEMAGEPRVTGLPRP